MATSGKGHGVYAPQPGVRDFVFKTRNCVSKHEKLCVKNDEFCIISDEFCRCVVWNGNVLVPPPGNNNDKNLNLQLILGLNCVYILTGAGTMLNKANLADVFRERDPDNRQCSWRGGAIGCNWEEESSSISEKSGFADQES